FELTNFYHFYFKLSISRLKILAEREGFEPSVPLPVRQFSKLFLSATQASLRILECKYSNSNYFAKIFQTLKMINFLMRYFWLFLLFDIVIDAYMIDTHQHSLEYFPDRFDLFEVNI